MLLDSSNSWPKNPYGIVLGDDFTTFKESLEYMLDDEFNQNESFVGSLSDYVPEYMTDGFTSDTSVGGNDAINPYWQYGRDDDIIHPIYSNDGGRCNTGLGRVYAETHEANQQILWMTMGVPVFASLNSFYLDSGDSKLSKLMNTGDIPTSLYAGSIVGGGIKLLFYIPFFPIVAINSVLGSIVKRKVTKYYDFKSAMPLYYQMVNGVLAHLAVGLGITANGVNKSGGANEGSTMDQYENVGVPEIMKNGPDIFAIMDKRASRIKKRDVRNTKDLLEQAQRPLADRSWWDKLTESLIASFQGGNDFVGFKVEKSTEITETISNASGPSSLVESLNSVATSARDKKFYIGGGGEGVIAGTVTNVMSTVGNFIKGITSGIAGDGGAVELVTGNGFFDIPDVWKSSEFNKSYSFNIQLRAKYGDPVSIYQSLYIPLAMLLAAALPRSIGKNMYTSPFIIRAYCKGMFAVPVGIIESMTIKRGASENGWNNTNLPLAIDISMNIKDLSPAMFLSLANGATENIMDAFSDNNSMQEYLTTLSGIGLQERYYRMAGIKRKIEASLLIFKNKWTNPIFYANSVSHSNIGRSLCGFSPWSRMGNN